PALAVDSVLPSAPGDPARARRTALGDRGVVRRDHQLVRNAVLGPVARRHPWLPRRLPALLHAGVCLLPPAGEPVSTVPRRRLSDRPGDRAHRATAPVDRGPPGPP